MQVYFAIKEKCHNGRLKYMYEDNGSNILKVSFSGFAAKPSYNYIRTLRDLKCNKFSFWMILLIEGVIIGMKMVKTHHLSLLSRLYLAEMGAIGSVKGGTCAIYYGLMFGASGIYSGACQYHVGAYLNSEDRVPVFKAMMCKYASKEEQKILDGMMPNIIRVKLKEYYTLVVFEDITHFFGTYRGPDWRTRKE